MTFGAAIECLKQGYAVARKGWNGKNMFLYLTGGSVVDFQDLRGNSKRFVTKETTRADATCINPHIDMPICWVTVKPAANSDCENLKELIYPRAVDFPQYGRLRDAGVLKNRSIPVQF